MQSADVSKKPSPARSSSADVYANLKRKILDHSILPATKLNILQLSQELGVSATPVREALRLLQGDNLLDAISNKGYQTTPILDARGVKDLFELRLLIEPWAAGVAASNRVQNPGLALDQEIESFDATAGPIQQIMINHDSRFHKMILQSTDNKLVIRAFDQSHCHLHLFRMFGANWDWKTSVDQHRQIAKAISSANPKAAEAAMRTHLHSAYRGFIEAMSDAVSSDALGEFSPSQLVQQAE